MIRSRKAESNIIAELILVGIAVSMSAVVFLTMTNDDTAGTFGSLMGNFEGPSEILSINDLLQKCPGTDASVLVKNTGGLDANVRAIAINDATDNTNVEAKYPNSASSISFTNGSTSDPLENTQCNDSTYMDITSEFTGTTTDVVSNMNFTSNINGWTSSSSSTGGTTSLKYYLTTILTTGFGSDYRELKLTADSPNSSTIISFGKKEDKHFLFKPGQDNSSTISSAHNSTPKGFGWRTVDAFSSVTASGTWNFGLRLQGTNLDDSDGHIECEIYSADPDGSDATRLFFLHPDDVNVLDDDNSGQTINYVFTHDTGSITLTGKILLYECYLYVDDNDSSSNADLILTVDSNSYIEIPLSSTITIDSVTHDASTGNPSPGSGAGSAKGGINDLSGLVAMGTIDYYFQYQFTTPAQFDSMAASYAWSYTESGAASNTKLNFARLIITDLSGNLITTLHCDDNGAATCGSSAGWTSSTSFTYRRGITSTYALSPSTNYRLVVHFQVSDTTATDTATITLRIDDVGLEFIDGQYEVIAVLTGTSDATLSPSSMELFLDSTFSTSGVSVTVQGYDYTAGDYSTSDGQKTFVFATLNSDYMISKELDPADFLDNINPTQDEWKFKITATHPTSFTMSIDLIQMNVIASEDVLREVVNLNNVVIEPGETMLINGTLSRSLDSDTAYRVTIQTERNSYSTLFFYANDGDGNGGLGYGGNYGSYNAGRMVDNDANGDGSDGGVGGGSGGEDDDDD